MGEMMTIPVYEPLSWVIWSMDRDYQRHKAPGKTKREAGKLASADAIAKAIKLAESHLADAQARVDWLKAGAPGWVNKGGSYTDTSDG
jgi:hypothetical protein